jgi:hypothetical protein
MIGEQFLEMPANNEMCLDLLELFGFEIGTNIRENTRKLVELNNEVYRKYNNLEFLQNRIEFIKTIKRFQATQ